MSDVPLRPSDDPLVDAIFRAFEHYDWDDVEAADSDDPRTVGGGDISHGLARLAAHVAYQEIGTP